MSQQSLQRLTRASTAVGCAMSLLIAAGCDNDMIKFHDQCGPYQDWASSEYVLPYPVGTEYPCIQGNCSNGGHHGFWKHGYDFRMPIGTPITAAREGRVLYVWGNASDGDPSRTNVVTVEHPDGTVALYAHLTTNGPQVRIGDRVAAGDPIGLSGNSGWTGGTPHLHFSLHTCGGLPDLPRETDCPSLPVTFRNTEPNPEGLVVGQSYAALAF